MSLLDNESILLDNTDLIKISNEGFPNKQLLNKYLDNYPHGARDYKSLSKIRGSYAQFNYDNKQWFLMNSKIKEFADKRGIYIIGVSSYTKYNNICINNKHFGFGWINCYDVHITDRGSHKLNNWTSTLYGQYSTYEEAVKDSYKFLTYIKENPGYAFYLQKYIQYDGVPGYRTADKLINFIKAHYEFTR